MADTAIAEMIRNILTDREPRELSGEGKRAAGVLVLCSSNTEGQHTLILTKRTSRGEHHKGEVSFPGGARDAEDTDIIATALRETYEEIGIPSAEVEILGSLDQDSTRTGYLIFPVVGNLKRKVDFRPSPYEVDEILEIPISHLLDPRYTQYEESVMDGSLVSYNSYWYDTDLIWGATARIITGFLNLTAHCFAENEVR